MNRTDLVKKSVERGVADAAEAESVSDLFYVYLLSALQRGQSIEIPGFGIFGTRIVGSKKVRKVPYFEADDDLAEKINVRFRDLKYVVIGRYDRIIQGTPGEFKEGEPPYDLPGEQLGASHKILDTYHEVTIDDYARTVAESKSPQPSKEEFIMPRLNLKDDSLEGESGPLDSDKDLPAPPTLRDVGGGGGRSSPLLLIVLIVIAIGAGVFALNYFKVIHLWGKKVVKVAEVFPEAGTSTGAESSTDMGAAVAPETAQPATEPLPEPGVAPPTAPEPASTSAPSQKAPKAMPPPAGSGSYTLQVSSWTSKTKADEEASKMSAAGYSAFVEDAVVAGENWYRVRVGRYGSTKEAEEAAAGIQKMVESVIWVAKVGGK